MEIMCLLCILLSFYGAAQLIVERASRSRDNSGALEEESPFIKEEIGKPSSP